MIALLALTDMRPNVATAAVILVLGVALIGWLQSPAAPARDRRGVPLVAFLCGPTVAFLWFLADVYWMSPASPIYLDDYLGSLFPMLLIGVTAGAVGAGAFWVGLCIRARRRC
jgi:hypothetical protein